MKRGTPEHPKTKELARRLKIKVPHAVGILEMLWHFTSKYAPRGDVGRYSDQRIAEECGWHRKSSELIAALCAESSRWLDECEENRLVVHDWPDHADQNTKKLIERNGWTFAQIVRKISTPEDIHRYSEPGSQDNHNYLSRAPVSQSQSQSQSHSQSHSQSLPPLDTSSPAADETSSVSVLPDTNPEPKPTPPRPAATRQAAGFATPRDIAGPKPIETLAKRGQLEDWFDVFWQLYPAGRRTEKILCQQLFVDKLSKAPDPEALFRQIVQPLEPDGAWTLSKAAAQGYMPGAKNYLAQERWCETPEAKGKWD